MNYLSPVYFIYSVTLNDFPDSSHLCKFISKDDIMKIFESQLKQVKKDHLYENSTLWNTLRNYLSEVILIMIHYFMQKEIDRSTYYKANKIQRTGWRNAILVDLHALDRITIDIRVNAERGTTLINNLHIHNYTNW